MGMERKKKCPWPWLGPGRQSCDACTALRGSSCGDIQRRKEGMEMKLWVSKYQNGRHISIQTAGHGGWEAVNILPPTARREGRETLASQGDLAET